MKKSIRFVYFDVGGVLLNFVEAHKKVARQYGVPYESVLAVFEKYWRDECRGKISGSRYMELFAEVLGMKPPLKDAGDFWSDHFLSVTPMHDLIHELKDIYKLGILSNAGPGVLDQSFRKGHIPGISWATVVDSSQHGVIKPEAKIYEIAEEMAGVDPAEIFFIDDVPEHITVAQARGWQGMVFDTGDVEGTVRKLKKKLLHQST